MAVFPILADPSTYRACDSDLLIDAQARRYWLDLFDSHFEVQLKAAGDIGVSESARANAAAAFHEEIDRLRAQPDRFGRLDILLLDELRQRILNECGIRDEFRLIKARENESAFAELPRWIDRIDATAPGERLPLIVRGMIAGNLFDMGVMETAGRFATGGMPFEEALACVPARPWLIDELDDANGWWVNPANRGGKAVIFADNAGGDVVLGVLPLAREMLQRGWQVVLTANSDHALNDVTHLELIGHVERAARLDDIWDSPELLLVESGNAAPLIDLKRISDELAFASRDADLIVLVGMGRGIESNFSARFTRRAWHIAMLKDPQVAKSINGKVYDALFRQKTSAAP